MRLRTLLVIGYGNELRGDDGLGPRLAEAIEQLRFPGVSVLVCHQLTFELAEPISKADAVLFLDAAIDVAAQVQLRPLCPYTSSQLRTHQSNPSALLALARNLYGRSPGAWWLTLPAQEMGYRIGLSKRAQTMLKAALPLFEKLWQRVQPARNFPDNSPQPDPRNAATAL